MRRTRATDTISGITAAFAAAAEGLPELPAQCNLRPQDQPYWRGIVCTRPRAEWTQVQLVAAAQLARVQADLNAWLKQLDTEPSVIVSGPHDSPKPNPLISIIEQATRRQLALMRSLGLANTEDPRELGKRQDAMRHAHSIRDEMSEHPLLAN